MLVSPEKHYDYSVSGAWQTAKDGAEVTADGARDGSGRLEGVVFHDFQLSQPFPLGSYGSFTPPVEGKLYVRCHDAWNHLADNRGAMTVKIKLAGAGEKLPRPTRKSEAPPERATAKPRLSSACTRTRRAAVSAVRLAVYNATLCPPASIATPPPPILMKLAFSSNAYLHFSIEADDREDRQPGLCGHGNPGRRAARLAGRLARRAQSTRSATAWNDTG